MQIKTNLKTKIELTTAELLEKLNMKHVDPSTVFDISVETDNQDNITGITVRCEEGTSDS